jgi:hypothetical protein
MFVFSLFFLIDPATVLNRVDGAAESLGVHVRRIYELIKILEILSLVAVRLIYFSYLLFLYLSAFVLFFLIVCW